MEITQQGYVHATHDNGLCTIEFFHPSHNSLPSNLLAELTQAITAAGQDETVQIILLKSSGDRTFCAGASFDELMAIEDEISGRNFFMGFANVINAMRKCPKVIICRVQGKAVGGGVGLASAADYCMATQYASVKLSELAIGIGPFVISPAVIRKIGLEAASQMTFNATEWYTADWAKQRGLFAEVFKTTEQLDEYLAHFINNMRSFSPVALSEMKKVFWEGTENWDSLLAARAAQSGRLVLSDFTKAAIEKFKNRS